MSLAHYQSTAVDEAGNVLSGATVTVRRESDGSLAATKSDRGGDYVKANPFTTDADGMFDFYVAGGAYKITVVSGSLTRTYRYVAIGTAAELDASDLAGLHGLLYERLTSTSAASITAGKFSGNNADLALATALYFSTTDANGNDQYTRLLTFDDSTSLVDGVLSLSLTSGDVMSFSVTAVTDLTDSSPAYDVIALTVTALSGSDVQIAGDDVYCDFSRTGDKGDQGIQGIQGIQGLTGPSPTLYWDYDSTTTDSDPGSGFFRINNATHSSATAIYVDNNSARGFSDVSAWLDTIDDSGDSTLRGYLLITQLDDPTVFRSYAVSGSVVDGTGYRKLTVAYIAGNGSLLDSSPGAVCSFDFIPRGPAGTGDVSATSTFGTDNRLIRSDGTSKNVQSTGITVDDSNNMTGVVSVVVNNDGLKTKDTDASHNLIISTDSNLTADRTLNINPGDASRSLTIGGDVTINGSPLEQGKYKFWIPSDIMRPRVTNGPSVGVNEMSTNKNNFFSLDFDTTTQEFAQFDACFGNSWNKGTVTFQPVWSHASTTTNFGVVWALQGVAISDADAMDAAFGTEQTSTDTGGTTNTRYIGPESAAITIAGTPANGDEIMFQVKRNPSDGSDTMAIDARLRGIWLFVTFNAATDA